MSHLPSLLSDPTVTIAEIARYLDSLDSKERWAQVGELGRAQQRDLYRKAADAPPLTTHDLHLDRELGIETYHRGRNTLPFLPGKARKFAKRFAKSAESDDEAYGYNDMMFTKLIGPGYFIAKSTAGHPEWEERGDVVVDYYQIPPKDKVPPIWPKVVPNTRGLQIAVFHGLQDFMRRVSKHVSIGIAFMRDKDLDQYFVLCAPDAEELGGDATVTRK